MNVRFKMTNKGEVAILPRKEFEALAAKAREADEDVSTARLAQLPACADDFLRAWRRSNR